MQSSRNLRKEDLKTKIHQKVIFVLKNILHGEEIRIFIMKAIKTILLFRITKMW